MDLEMVWGFLLIFKHYLENIVFVKRLCAKILLNENLT